MNPEAWVTNFSEKWSKSLLGPNSSLKEVEAFISDRRRDLAAQKFLSKPLGLENIHLRRDSRPLTVETVKESAADFLDQYSTTRDILFSFLDHLVTLYSERQLAVPFPSIGSILNWNEVKEAREEASISEAELADYLNKKLDQASIPRPVDSRNFVHTSSLHIASRVSDPSGGKTISEVSTAFLADGIDFKKWTLDTKLENEEIIQVLIESLGNIPIDQLTHDKAREFATLTLP